MRFTIFLNEGITIINHSDKIDVSQSQCVLLFMSVHVRVSLISQFRTVKYRKQKIIYLLMMLILIKKLIFSKNITYCLSLNQLSSFDYMILRLQ